MMPHPMNPIFASVAGTPSMSCVRLVLESAGFTSVTLIGRTLGVATELADSRDTLPALSGILRFFTGLCSLGVIFPEPMSGSESSEFFSDSEKRSSSLLALDCAFEVEETFEFDLLSTFPFATLGTFGFFGVVDLGGVWDREGVPEREFVSFFPFFASSSSDSTVSPRIALSMCRIAFDNIYGGSGYSDMLPQAKHLTYLALLF